MDTGPMVASAVFMNNVNTWLFVTSGVFANNCCDCGNARSAYVIQIMIYDSKFNMKTDIYLFTMFIKWNVCVNDPWINKSNKHVLIFEPFNH